jgi:hypothetical protein
MRLFRRRAWSKPSAAPLFFQPFPQGVYLPNDGRRDDGPSHYDDGLPRYFAWAWYEGWPLHFLRLNRPLLSRGGVLRFFILWPLLVDVVDSVVRSLCRFHGLCRPFMQSRQVGPNGRIHARRARSRCQ